MQRPFVLLATNDPKLEDAAIKAVLETCHGLRVVHDLREATTALAEGSDDVALMIVDLDFDGQGTLLLSILGSSEPDFPVLAVAEPVISEPTRRLLSEAAVESLPKPVDVEDLRNRVEEICRVQEKFSHSAKVTLGEARFYWQTA